MRRGARSGAVLAFLLGSGVPACGDDGPAASSGNATTPSPPETTGASTGGGTSGSTGGTVGATSGSGQIPCTESTPGCVCASDHVAGQQEAGDPVCQNDLECIPDGFVSLWCIDDAGCCGAGTCDTRTGFCEGGSSSSDTGTSTSTSTSG